MRALRDFNTPKIVTDDVPIFMGLIGDLFPALNVPRKRDLDFEAMVKKSVIVSNSMQVLIDNVCVVSARLSICLCCCSLSLVVCVHLVVQHCRCIPQFDCIYFQFLIIITLLS